MVASHAKLGLWGINTGQEKAIVAEMKQTRNGQEFYS